MKPTPLIQETNNFLRDYAKETGDSDLYLRFNEEVENIVRAVNAHEKLLEAVKMVFEAADEASSQELGQNIDWDMLRDAYNLGLKGEA